MDASVCTRREFLRAASFGAAAVSLANAAMYQQISDLRDDLVQRTAELSVR